MAVDFDIAPLTWVRGEIDQALERALASLRAYAADPSNADQLKAAQAHLHQAHGALQIVGLDGVTRLSEELEGLLADLRKSGGAPRPEALKAAEEAFGATSAYLDQLLQGEPNRPLRLFAVYRDLVAARNGGQADPVDLYLPDLTQRPPARKHPFVPLSPKAAPAYYREQRARFQRGLLKLLKKDISGTEEMRAAIAAIEATAVQPSQRAFWWIALGFFDALVARAVAINPAVARLSNRVEQQLRRLADGSLVVADRLIRELLFAVARARPATEHLREVQETYQLADSIPAAFELKQEAASQHPALKALREALASAKTAWNKAAAGHGPSLASLREHVGRMKECATELSEPNLAGLTDEIAAVAEWLGDDQARVSDAVAMEMATALLLAENAAENFASLAPEFGEQARTMRARLTDCMRGAAPERASEVPLLDEMSRRAQERLLMAQVVAEIQANLRTVEQALDAFFRDPTQRAELVNIDKLVRQAVGALRILNEERAAAALTVSAAAIQRFAEANYAPAPADFESVAGTLSGLGFYVDALQYGKADFDAIMKPIGVHEEPALPAGESALPVVASVEQELERGRRELEALHDAWKASPRNGTLKEKLKAGLAAIQKDAGLVADGALESKVGQALSILATSGVLPTDAALMASIASIGPVTAPIPGPSLHTSQLMKASAETVDAELLDIYLEEAGEVLATIASHLVEARAGSQNIEVLRTIRRGFHTLKGSGRMVGLTRLGEAAWAVEQVMNRWLEDERPGTADLYALIAAAHDFFDGAVLGLKQGTPSPDESAIVAMAQRVKDGGTIAAAAPIEPQEVSALTAQPQASASLDIGPQDDRPPLPELLTDDFELPPLTASQPPAAEGAIAPEINFDFLTDAEPRSATSRETVPDAAATAAQQIITIGDSELSPALYETFLAEAQSHLSDMQQAHLRLGEGAPVSEDLERKAHTLAGIAGTVKLETIRAVGQALEHFFDRHLQQPIAPEGRTLFGQALATLEKMLESAAAREMPQGAPEVVSQLDAYTSTAKQAEAPQAETLLDFTSLNFVAPEADAELPLAATSATEHIAAVETPLAEPIVEETLTPVIEALPASEPPANVVAFPSPQDGRVSPKASVEVEEIPLERRERRIEDDLDQELLPIFLEEANELVPAVGRTLRDWRENAQNAAPGLALQRVLHTLKGSARMCGAMVLGELTHAMETRVEHALTIKMLPQSLFDDLDGAYDRLSLLFERLQNPQAHPEPLPELSPSELAAPVVATEETAERSAAAPARVKPAAFTRMDTEAASQAARAVLRVRADMVDRLVNQAGEVSIARSRIEGELRTLKGSIGDLTENVNRLRTQLREIEIAAESQMQSRLALSHEKDTSFDPLEFDRFTRFQELTRMMAESVNDVATVQQSVLKALGDTDAALLAQSRITREHQTNLMRVRMVPFASISERLFRVVRQASKDTGKRVVLDIRGGQVEVDRSVLERITAPFEHMLRNSVAHGIEDGALRLGAGKAELGEIDIEVRQEGNEVVLAVKDDGAGIDLPRVREKAISLGLLSPSDTPSETEIAELVFRPGFSTAAEVTQLAGRGVGMDVVKSEVTALGGRVEIQTAWGKGTTFTIYLPLTLAVTQAVIVRVGGMRYAIPAAMIEQVRQLKEAELAAVTGALEATWQERKYPFRYLPHLLGDPAAVPEVRRVAALLFLRSGPNIVAVQVDEMFGNQEIVVKNTGPLLARIAGITGATVLGSGEILLIINPVILAARELALGHNAPEASVEEAPTRAPMVMIVDDSLTVRKIAGRLLAREGYQVVTAKDGVDALEQLQELVPDVMLVDIEMPRMDGFDLTRNIRGDKRLAHVPIIMITSRTADKHRAYAKQIGVNVYLGKPYQEEELLRNIESFVGHGVSV